MQKLSDIAKYEPQAAYSAYTHAFLSKWTYLQRVIPGCGDLFQPLEDIIRQQFLPAVTGQASRSALEREIISLPPRDGGLGIPDPTKTADKHYTQSRKITAGLTQKILKQERELRAEEQRAWTEDKQRALKEKKQEQEQQKKAILEQLRRDAETEHPERGGHRKKIKKPPDPPLMKKIEMASQKGASNWLTSVPLKELGHARPKQEWHDGMCLRYGWTPTNLPSTCVCGKEISTQHLLDCPRGGYQIYRHNALCKCLANLCQKAGYKDVKIEPHLAPMPPHMQRTTKEGKVRSTDSDEARLDFCAVGVWGEMQRAFFDVRVTNPLAPSYSQKKIEQHLKNEEASKKTDYNKRILEVERASFTPLVFTVAGGCGREATVFLQTLARKLADRSCCTPSMAMPYIFWKKAEKDTNG